MASPLQFDFPSQIINIPIADSSLDLQFLLNSIREAEDDISPGMSYPKIADAFGKQDLGNGVLVGITVVLLDGWRIKFADRPGLTTVSCSVTGGNFVGEAGANPVAPSTYTQVTTQQSSSATIITPSSQADTNLVYLVESLRNSHPAFGNVFYWDPYAGSDTNNGLTPSSAVQTFSTAHSLATAGNNDVIFCRSTDPSGTSTVTENLNITKHNLKVRGPGNSVQIIPSGTGSASLTITADNVEFSGFYLETAATGTQNAVSITGNNVLFRDCWINNTRGHGISATSSARLRILTSVIENCGGSGTGNGIHLGNSTTQSLTSKCLISDCINGIALSGTGLSGNIIENCLIYKNTSYGVSIGSGVNLTALRSANTITNNTTGNTLDNGTETYIETPAGGASTTDIADAVWNEVIADHVTSGSTGRTLRDAKLKATIASIK